MIGFIIKYGRILSDMRKKYFNLEHLSESILALICLIAVFGGLVYRFYALNRLGVIISLILAIIAFFIIQYSYLISNKTSSRSQLQKPKNGKFRLIDFIFYILYFILLFFCFYILIRQQNAGAIVSPWQIVPNYFFIIYSLATLLLLANVIINRKFALPLIMLHYFLSFSVALIVYRLGYGYDPFIHRATENLIDQTGAVNPKPFYYLGQYALVIILHKITCLPIDWLDKLMVPFLAAFFLPPALWRAFKAWFTATASNLLLITASLILGFSFFIVTTPQNLAYLLLILAVFTGLTCKNLYDFSLVLILAAAATLVHPVAGIPAMLFAGFLAVYRSDNSRVKKYLYPLLALITVFILPALFYVLNRRLTATAPTDTPTSEALALGLNMPVGENFILNFIYLYGFNLKFIIAALALGGIYIAWKNREHCKILRIYLTISLALFASYFLTVRLPFAFLINYERDDYPLRILMTAIIFLLPFMILSLYWLIEKVSQKNIFIKLSFAVFLLVLLSASLYLSYPRYDDYFNSRGYSVSADDLEAVKFINQNAKSDFIVLADQQVGAAALSQFGFKKYYGELFYYPIPTGSPLYQYYLNMVYKKADHETMDAAMALAGVNESYFVLNKYWWAFPKILDEAKFSADSWQEISGGQVYVFKYLKNNQSKL